MLWSSRTAFHQREGEEIITEFSFFFFWLIVSFNINLIWKETSKNKNKITIVTIKTEVFQFVRIVHQTWSLRLHIPAIINMILFLLKRRNKLMQSIYIHLWTETKTEFKGDSWGKYGKNLRFQKVKKWLTAVQTLHLDIILKWNFSFSHKTAIFLDWR